MPLKPLPYRDIRRKLLAAGFFDVGQEGSHVKCALQEEQGITVGTIRSIIRQAGITPEEWDLL